MFNWVFNWVFLVSTQLETTTRTESTEALTVEITTSSALKLRAIKTQSTPTIEAGVTTTTTVGSAELFAPTTTRALIGNTVLASGMLTTAITNIRETSKVALTSSVITNIRETSKVALTSSVIKDSSNNTPTQKRQAIAIATQATPTTVAGIATTTVSSTALFAATRAIIAYTVLTSSMLTTAKTKIMETLTVKLTSSVAYASKKKRPTQEKQKIPTQLTSTKEAGVATTTTTTTTTVSSSAASFVPTIPHVVIVNTILTRSFLTTAKINIKKSSVAHVSNENMATQEKQTIASQLTATTEAAAATKTATVTSAGLFAPTTRRALIVNAVLTSTIMTTTKIKLREASTVTLTSTVAYASSENPPIHEEQTAEDKVLIFIIPTAPGWV